MGEGGDAGAIMSPPRHSASRYNELAVRAGLDERVGAGNHVPGRLELLEGPVNPAALGGPVGDGGSWPVVRASFEDHRVEGQFHLVDGDAVRVHLDRLHDGGLPLALGLAEHCRR